MNISVNVKRFVDTFPFAFSDDADFESKHKRDNNGQFAKTESANGEKEIAKKHEKANEKEDKVEKESGEKTETQKAKEESKAESPDKKEKPKFDKEKFKELCGKEFKGFYRQSAVRKLLEEQQGHVKGAFYRKEIGSIDLIWGDDNIGLKHIIKRRLKNNQDPMVVLKNMSDTIQNGFLYYDETRDSYQVWGNKLLFSISKTFFGEDLKLVVTGYEHTKKPKWLEKNLKNRAP